MYDLILKDGHIVDPSQGLNGANDIAVQDGVIAAIAPSITEEAARVVNAHGKTVTPGLIDTHTHVYRGDTPPALGLDPDLISVRAGVTTVLDAGSAGCNTFEGFPLYVIPNAHTEIVPFLHIGRSGQDAVSRYPRGGEPGPGKHREHNQVIPGPDQGTQDQDDRSHVGADWDRPGPTR